MVHLFAIARAKLAPELLRMTGDDIHDAAALLQAHGLALLVLRGVIDEELGEEFRGRVFGRDHAAVLGVGGAIGSSEVEHKGGKTSLVSEVLGEELIDGDSVFKNGTP